MCFAYWLISLRSVRGSQSVWIHVHPWFNTFRGSIRLAFDDGEFVEFAGAREEPAILILAAGIGCGAPETEVSR